MKKEEEFKNIKIIICPSKDRDDKNLNIDKCAGIVCVGVCSSDVPAPL